MLRYRKIVFSFLLLYCLVTLPLAGLAQSSTAPETGVTTEILEGRIQEVEASSDLEEADKSVLLDLYRKSQGLVNQRASYETGALEFIELRESAPRQASKLRKEIEQFEALGPPELPASLTREPLPRLEQQLLSEKASLAGLRASLTESESLLEAQSRRSQQVRERLEQGRQRQAEIAEAIKLPAAPGQSQRLAEARLWALQLETRALTAEIEMLNQELLSQPMRVELSNAQREKLSLEWDRQKKYVELIGVLVTDRRVSDAETAQQDAEETERQTFGKHPLVQEIAQSNTLLSNDLNQLAAQVEANRADESIVTDQIKRFSANFRLARQKLEIAGLSKALGQSLLQQRNNLPRAKDFRAAEKQRQQLVIESSLRQILNQQERARLSDMEAYIDEHLGHLSRSWQSWIRDEVRELALQRRSLLDKAIAADDSLLQALSELDFAQRELSKVVTDYNRYLDERLLWVRTGAPPSLDMLESMMDTIVIFVTLQNWIDLGYDLLKPQSFPWALLVGFLLVALLMQQRRRVRGMLKRSGVNVGQLRHDRFYNSIKALLLTLVLALPWPVVMVALGLHLQLVQGVDAIDIDAHLYQASDWNGQFVPSIGAAFYDLALYTFCFAPRNAAPDGGVSAHDVSVVGLHKL